MNKDPWIFTDTIKVYNWESHPDWFKCPLNPEEWFESIKNYHAERIYIPMIELKRMLNCYGCLGWDNASQQNFFNPTENWIKNRFYPVELPTRAKNLYKIDYNQMPILTSDLNLSDKSDLDITGTWKIYYSGGSDVGSIRVNTLDRFKQDVENCHKFQLMYLPEIYINKP